MKVPSSSGDLREDNGLAPSRSASPESNSVMGQCFCLSAVAGWPAALGEWPMRLQSHLDRCATGPDAQSGRTLERDHDVVR